MIGREGMALTDRWEVWVRYLEEILSSEGDEAQIAQGSCGCPINTWKCSGPA